MTVDMDGAHTFGMCAMAASVKVTSNNVDRKIV